MGILDMFAARCNSAASKGSILQCGARPDPRCQGGNCTAHCREHCQGACLNAPAKAQPQSAAKRKGT